MPTNIKHLRKEDAAKLSHMGRKYFNLIEFDNKERLIAEIRKHPIGLFFIYLTGCSIAVIAAVIFGLASFTNGLGDFMGGAELSGSVRSLIVVGGFLFIVFVLIAMTIQAVLYTHNVIFVTSDKIAQILYMSLFHRKISQLSIGDVQDVTVTQRGVLAHFFNYGTLVIETAGEQQNYTFTYIPEPYKYSKLIVGSHETNLHMYGN